MRSKISLYIYIIEVLLLILISCNKDDKSTSPVKDVEGNSYKTVRIGNQVWTAENLKTTKYNDGTDIPLITDTTAWRNLTTPGYCWYNNEESKYKDTYGALYNAFTIKSGDLCPAGWHVPTMDEIQQLREFLVDTLNGGGNLKEAGTAHWLTPNTGADNSSGFTALAAGIRYFEGTYSSILDFTGIWSASEVDSNEEWYLSLYYDDAIVNMNHTSRNQGLSVRCVKD
jgi:uncharacterized protein (TIGR02145 family)